MNQENGLASLDQWDAIKLRLTLFPKEPLKPSDQDGGWGKLLGEPPDNTLDLSKGTERRLQSIIDGKLYTFRARRERLDWLVDSTCSEAERERPSLGNFSVALAVVDQLFRRYLEESSLPDIKRMAFGAELEHIVPEIAEGNRWISRFLNSLSMDNESLGSCRELLFQINHPASSSEVPQLLLNRLCKWSVKRRTGGILKTGPQPHYEAIHEYIASCLELDMNTDADRTEALPADKLCAVFAELENISRRIAQDGERA
jgi:hypothetical protein